MVEIAGETLEPGEHRRLEIPVARLPTQTQISIPVRVINGVSEGARLWISAAIHGDEINGVEIIRQIVQKIDSQKLQGTLVAVPIVNVFGFIEQSRYLPDRRDLNRSFPGSTKGSLASRLAHLFMNKIVSCCTHGIDLHTASDHRVNLPQIRANLEDEETYRCAKAFGAPIMLHSTTRDGSLRQAATKCGIPILLYEGGEALRFEAEAIRVGVEGILRVMDALGMYQHPEAHQGETPIVTEQINSLAVTDSTWVRASCGGILHLEVSLGQQVAKKQVLGIISDAFGDTSLEVRAAVRGIIIGHTRNPLVNQGDGIVHLAILK
jgi:predicted deacylase